MSSLPGASDDLDDAIHRSSLQQLQSQLEQLKITDTGRTIGLGSYGRVLEVCVHGTLCAAKEIHSLLVDNVSPKEFEFRKRSFLLECEYACRMRHPNLVQVLGIYYPTPQAKLPWLVMELLDTSLNSFLNKYTCDRVPLHLKFSILVDISQGLEFLHGHKIVHRDLSSNNVLLTKHLVAKISDLGVAKVINEMGHHTQTPGTPHFMPPEALLVKPIYDTSVDIFSLACVMLHIMSHEWPVPENQITEDKVILTEVQRRKSYLQFCTLSSLSRDCAVDFDDLRKLVESCLHNKPEERPTILAVREWLQKFYTFFEKFCSLGTVNRVDMYDLAQKSIVRINELCFDLKKADQRLMEVETTIAEMEAIIKQKDIRIQGLIQKLIDIQTPESNQGEQLHHKLDKCTSHVTTTFSRSVSLGGVHDSDNQSTLRYQTSVRSNIAKPKPIATNNLPPCELPASTNPKGGHKEFVESLPSNVGNDFTEDKSKDIRAIGTESKTRRRSLSLYDKPKDKTKRGIKLQISGPFAPTTIPSMNSGD